MSQSGRSPGWSRAGCHGGLQTLLLVPSAPAAGRWPPPSARAGSGTHPVAGAGTMGWRGVPCRGRGLRQQVRYDVRSLSFHKSSCPVSPSTFIPQGRSLAPLVSFPSVYPKPKFNFPLRGWSLSPGSHPLPSLSLSLMSFALDPPSCPVLGFLSPAKSVHQTSILFTFGDS